MREPRNLGEESKCRAHEKTRKRGRAEIGPAPLLRFVAFQARASYGPFHVNVFHDVRDRPKGNLPAVRPRFAPSRNFSYSSRFDRYDIICKGDFREAAQKLSSSLAQFRAHSPKSRTGREH